MFMVVGALLGMIILPWRTPDATLYFLAGSMLLLMIMETAGRYTVSYRFIYAILFIRAAYSIYTIAPQLPAKIKIKNKAKKR
jgi:uncharacterized membrane protein